MHKDYQLLKRLPKVVSVGVFKVDVSDITSSICKNVESCMTEIFNTHIYSKMSKLLSENKQKTANLKKQLRQTAPNIEAYIELKSFLEGDDLLATIRNIGSDIKLCRQLNNFEEKFNIKSFELFNEYMESLTWVNELEVLHESGLKRLRDALPRFYLEIQKKTEALFEEFEKEMVNIRAFDSNSDLKEAETYFHAANALYSKLEDYIVRANDINSKQEILGYKLTNFNHILVEKTSFVRYVDLWDFIADEWNSVKKM
jgi:hypothetical protein